VRINISPRWGLILLSGVTIVTICLATVFLLWEQRGRELDHARLETTSINRMLMEQTEQMFSGVDFLLQGVQERLRSSFGSQLPLDSAQVQLLLAAKSSGAPHISSIFLVGADGMVANTSRDKPVQADVSHREYFRVFAKNEMAGLYIGVPEFATEKDHHQQAGQVHPVAARKQHGVAAVDSALRLGAEHLSIVDAVKYGGA